jgi:hypothetical protein
MTVSGATIYNDNNGYQALRCLSPATDLGSAVTSCTVSGQGVQASVSSPSANCFTVTYTAVFSAPTGSRDLSCIYQGSTLTHANDITVADATPSISVVNPMATLYPGGPPAYITIWGKNFGAVGSANKLTFTPSPGSCGSAGDIQYQIVQADDWGSLANEQSRNYDQINALVTALPKACANGSYDVQITSGGVSGNGFQASPQGGSKAQSDAAHAVNVTQVLIKLEFADPTKPTIISLDGNYSEDTKIKVTAVQADGTPITNWSGTVNLYEDTSVSGYVSVYNAGTGLPESVTIPPNAGGSTTFVAKSLVSSPDKLNPPNPARLTTKVPGGMVLPNDYAIYAGPLQVPQWIVTNTIDTPPDSPDGKPHAAAGTYDWVAARARDIVGNYTTGDVATMLSHVKSYSVAYLSPPSGYPSGGVVGGQTHLSIPHQNSLPIVINAYSGYQMRNDTRLDVGCGYSLPKFFTGTFIHESRHTYQDSLAMFNDTDDDFLIGNMPANLPDASTIVDSTEIRTVCNTYSGAPVQGSFLGDVNADPISPDDPAHPGGIIYVTWALEQDAYAWVASVLGK